MINKAEQNLKDSLIAEIASLKRDMQQLKAATQPVGGDSLNVIASGGGLAGPVTLASNSWVMFSSNAYTSPQRRTLWVRHATIYVDALDHQHAWPKVIDGTGVLTSAQQDLGVTFFYDYEDTDFTTGVSLLKVYVLNRDSSSHNVWMRVRSFLPKQPTA